MFRILKVIATDLSLLSSSTSAQEQRILHGSTAYILSFTPHLCCEFASLFYEGDRLHIGMVFTKCWTERKFSQPLIEAYGRVKKIGNG
ncbi:hypothetical protein KCU79_g90, partial [Aureobasidium melanogenum]